MVTFIQLDVKRAAMREEPSGLTSADSPAMATDTADVDGRGHARRVRVDVRPARAIVVAATDRNLRQLPPRRCLTETIRESWIFILSYRDSRLKR